jgi:CRISPR/Cas system CMR-associated protein Cmr3 (group 5 of RAMP superfamily)
MEKKVLVIDKIKLVEKGYQFEYCTEHYTTKENEQYYYCYDYGYRPLDDEKLMVVKDTRKKTSKEKKQELVRSGG